MKYLFRINKFITVLIADEIRLISLVITVLFTHSEY